MKNGLKKKKMVFVVRADLSETDLSNKDLSYTNLTAANLDYALLENSDLRCSFLNSTNFLGGKFKKCKFV